MSSARARFATLAALTVAATAGAGTLAAAPAAAASPTVVLVGSQDEITIVAGDGTDNVITVVPGTPGISVTDTGAAIHVADSRDRCRLTDPHTVHCGRAVSLTVHLGDGTNRYQSLSDVPSVIHGGRGVDVIQGGPGRDEVYGDHGTDEIHGGAGDDALDGGSLGDRVYGDAGNDTLWGLDNDRAYGGPGDDRFHEHNGRMHFYGEDGNDLVLSVHAGGQRDFFGGAGYDTIDYSAWDRKVHVSLDGDDDDGERGVADCDARFPWSCGSFRARQNVHSDFENVTGSPKDDWIEGNGLGNILLGMAGNDVVEGFAGDDVVDAGSGPGEDDQKVRGGAGSDICRGSGVDGWPGCER